MRKTLHHQLGQAVRRQGPLLSRSHRHRRRPHDKARRDDHPGGLRQGVPRVERQGRRPRLGTAAAGDDADARQDAGRPETVRRISAAASSTSSPLSDDNAAGKALLDVLQADVPAEVRDKVHRQPEAVSCPTNGAACATARNSTATIGKLLGKPETAPTGLALIAAAEKRRSRSSRWKPFAINGRRPTAVRLAGDRRRWAPCHRPRPSGR